MFVKLKPAPGLKIRHPQTLRHLPPEGDVVELESYWVRLLASGDVIEVTQETAPANSSPVVDVQQIPDSSES